MNAKELYARFSSLTDVEVFQHRVVIARALSLLASVEDGEGIVRELEECERIVGNLCADGRCPKMSIPVRDDDEDMRLTRTMKQAAARITLDAQEKAALKGQADVLDALNTSQAHEIALLKTKLASVKAERDALKERIWQIRVELGALFTMLPNEVPGLAMEVCERDADRQCLFRAFELAAHKEGA